MKPYVRYAFAAKVLFAGLPLLRLFTAPVSAQVPSVSTAPVLIERIVFRGNRTDEKLLRRRLPFSEGGVLGPDTLKNAKTGLWDMRQFKRVDVSSSTLPGGNAEIEITVADGWYLLPLPFFSGGSGGGRGGIMLFGMNIFRQAESVMLSAFSGSTGSSQTFFVQRERRFLSASVRRRNYTERRYADGAFSSGSGSGRPPDEHDPSSYGLVAESYRKSRDETALAAGLPLTSASGKRPGLSTYFGWERLKLGYSDPAPGTPGDPGRQDRVFIALKTGKDGSGGMDSVGAIFGFGLADMERRLAPLQAPRFASGAEVSFHRGASWTGSDRSYGYILGRWDGSVTWGTHRSLALRLAGGRGDDLPPGRLLATGRETGLMGNYAREFRGGSAAGASLIYSHPFRITRRGIWQGSLFTETARAWGGTAASGAKAGAGASFWYKFWRFPLPLGFSCTYSFDDHDSLFSAALGGRF